METYIPQIPADTLRDIALSIINNYKLKVATLGRIFDTMILTTTDGVDNGIGPNARRYVLRWGVKRSSVGSSPVPQRQCLRPSRLMNVDLLGAFTEDSTFS